MQEVNFEVYTKNPKTGELGWDIKFVSVVAKDKGEAKQMLAKWPLFDCIILFNYARPIEASNHDLFVLSESQKGCEGWLFDTHSYAKENFYQYITEIKI